MPTQSSSKPPVSKKLKRAQRQRRRALKPSHRDQVRKRLRLRERQELARQNWRPEPGRSKRKVIRNRVNWTVNMVLRNLTDGCWMMRSRALGGLRHWKLDSAMIKQFEAIFGYNGPGIVQNGLASNMTTRRAVAERWIRDAVAMVEEHPGRHFYMATFVDDRIRTRELDTEIRLRAFVKTVRNVLAYAGIIDWLGCTELKGFVNWKAGEGRTIAPHFHALFWTDEPLTAKARERLIATKRFETFASADSVVVTERLASPGQIAHWASYIFEAPERGGNEMASYVKPDENVARDAFLEPIFALRIMEVLSQMSLTSMIHAGGEGCRYREDLVSVINNRSKHSRSGWPLRPQDTGAIWARARDLANKASRKPVRFER